MSDEKNSVDLKRQALTRRETEILQWTACGKTSEEIAQLLSLSVPTVNTHIRNICGKLNAVNKSHAVALALVHKLIPFDASSSLTIPLEILFRLSKGPSEKPQESPPIRRTPKKQKNMKVSL